MQYITFHIMNQTFSVLRNILVTYNRKNYVIIQQKHKSSAAFAGTCKQNET